MSRSYLAGLFGQGIGPSLSPELHEREGLRQDLRYVYRSIELDDAQLAPERLRGLLAHAVELGFDGLNVTHPVKHVMTPLVDELSPGAAAIGAINTVVIRDGTTTGHNTDVTGFAAAVRQGLPGADLDDIVLVGAGGAGTAVAHALADLGAGALHVVDTDRGRAERLLATLGPGHAGRGSTDTPDRLPALLSRASGLVNATPMGMAAHPGAPVEAALLHDRLWVADIVYRPLVTALVRSATERGCRVLTGAGMAVNQAADSFELFTGRPASRAAMVTDFDELVAGELELPGRSA
ncbi:shikimate dehydrogenase [Blastococcus brunescens]|uniref:Shikimate dehydrogenase n=1 Tax=Blastococcus brunescens TaxID=1564165 RepID=A0ABZ1AY96_9ACTN|nr:shikimate dehydrogenase [Blastococcus sp. BMG 8361]WRL62074.1 shikimate dehydrogenase [Blastococcus sp. BMG 8361]